MNLEDIGGPESATLVWVLGAFSEIEKLGLVLPGNIILTPKGIHLYDQITQDFTPDDDMLACAVAEVCDEDCWVEMMLFLTLYRDDRDLLISLSERFQEILEDMSEEDD